MINGENYDCTAHTHLLRGSFTQTEGAALCGAFPGGRDGFNRFVAFVLAEIRSLFAAYSTIPVAEKSRFRTVKRPKALSGLQKG